MAFHIQQGSFTFPPIHTLPMLSHLHPLHSQTTSASARPCQIAPIHRKPCLHSSCPHHPTISNPLQRLIFVKPSQPLSTRCWSSLLACWKPQQKQQNQNNATAQWSLCLEALGTVVVQFGWPDPDSAPNTLSVEGFGCVEGGEWWAQLSLRWPSRVGGRRKCRPTAHVAAERNSAELDEM